MALDQLAITGWTDWLELGSEIGRISGIGSGRRDPKVERSCGADSKSAPGNPKLPRAAVSPHHAHQTDQVKLRTAVPLKS